MLYIAATAACRCDGILPIEPLTPAGVGGEAAAAMLTGHPRPCPRCRCHHLRHPSLSLTRSRQLPVPAKRGAAVACGLVQIVEAILAA
jgi:hypothetical protein